MTPPLITVITPAFNIEPYITEAIESVLAQTEGEFEYLIVDDGSSDETLNIARSYAERDSRVRVIPLEGSRNGSSAARNVALRVAKGKYIAFLDGDDRWNREFLQKSRTVLEMAPQNVGATFCATRYIDERGRYWGRPKLPRQVITTRTGTSRVIARKPTGAHSFCGRATSSRLASSMRTCTTAWTWICGYGSTWNHLPPCSGTLKNRWSTGACGQALSAGTNRRELTDSMRCKHSAAGTDARLMCEL